MSVVILKFSSAPGFTGEGAFFIIDEVSIYNAIPRMNIIKLVTVLQDICSQWLSKCYPAKSKFVKLIWTLMMLNYTIAVLLPSCMEELDQAYIWMVDDG